MFFCLLQVNHLYGVAKQLRATLNKFSNEMVRLLTYSLDVKGCVTCVAVCEEPIEVFA